MMRSMSALSGTYRTRAFSAAKFTFAETPGSRFSTFSIRAAHAAQVMPSSARLTVRSWASSRPSSASRIA
jgi:hypothetical protein